MAEFNIEQFHQFRNLFHGTDTELKEGDIVTPRTRKVAYSTPHLQTARRFGGNVYEVEPVNPESTYTRQMKYMGNQTHYETISEDGFRVGKQVPKSRRQAHYEALYRQRREAGENY